MDFGLIDGCGVFRRPCLVGSCRKANPPAVSADEGGGSGHRMAFTLVEVMVSLFLFALFIGGALGLLSQIMRTHYTVRDRTEATNLAWSRVERAANIEFSALPDLVESGIRINRAGLPDAEGDFLRTTSVSSLPGALEAVLIRVEVLPFNRRQGGFSGSPEVIETVLSHILKLPEEGL